ncbi:hypothetical protein BN2476_70061 [Paraburkholderia piptadeniae]|uniref:Uncharacterized protein n=1 Tax=Paraburkholderia piptadeniae TaxID=1701573 RepID=A0A1N7RLB1_9BURK|nr:hypothetical protein BN2476_70061 [Paraburkholderia piptadeniae]
MRRWLCVDELSTNCAISSASPVLMQASRSIASPVSSRGATSGCASWPAPFRLRCAAAPACAWHWRGGLPVRRRAEGSGFRAWHALNKGGFGREAMSNAYSRAVQYGHEEDIAGAGILLAHPKGMPLRRASSDSGHRTRHPGPRRTYAHAYCHGHLFLSKEAISSRGDVVSADPVSALTDQKRLRELKP